MRADNEFLGSLAGKLTEIADNCVDAGTQSELNELVEMLVDAIERPTVLCGLVKRRETPPNGGFSIHEIYGPRASR